MKSKWLASACLTQYRFIRQEWRTHLLLALLTFLPFCLSAKEVTKIKRAPSNSLMLGIGRANQLDTYLSPLEYTGPQLSLLHEYRRDIAWNLKASFHSILQAEGSATNAWGGSPDCWEGAIHYDAIWQYHLHPHILHNGLTIKVGGGIGTTLGGIYNTHGGNNPANAHLQLRMTAAVGATYSFRLFKRTWQANYDLDAPLLGTMFSPAFGQSYYEIFEQGNYDHNILLTHPGNCASLRQRLTLDIPVSKTKSHNFVRVGYLSDIRQAKPNHLVQHQFGHAFTFGFVHYITQKK